MSIESVMPSNHLTHCRPLLLPPSVIPSIGAFSNKLLRVPWKTRSQDAGPKAAVPTARHAPWMSFLCLASEPRLQGARGGNPLLGRAALPLRRPTGTPRLEWRGCGPLTAAGFLPRSPAQPGDQGHWRPRGCGPPVSFLPRFLPFRPPRSGCSPSTWPSPLCGQDKALPV